MRCLRYVNDSHATGNIPFIWQFFVVIEVKFICGLLGRALNMCSDGQNAECRLLLFIQCCNLLLSLTKTLNCQSLNTHFPCYMNAIELLGDLFVQRKPSLCLIWSLGWSFAFRWRWSCAHMNMYGYHVYVYIRLFERDAYCLRMSSLKLLFLPKMLSYLENYRSALWFVDGSSTEFRTTVHCRSIWSVIHIRLERQCFARTHYGLSFHWRLILMKTI